MTRAEDWQNGCAIVTIHTDGDWQYEVARISNGTAFFRGSTYRTE